MMMMMVDFNYVPVNVIFILVSWMVYAQADFYLLR